MRLDDGVFSMWFAENQGLRQVRARAAPVLFVAMDLKTTYTYFKTANDVTDAFLVASEGKTGDGAGGATPVEPPWRQRYGSFFTLTMPETYRNRSSSPGRGWA